MDGDCIVLYAPLALRAVVSTEAQLKKGAVFQCAGRLAVAAVTSIGSWLASAQPHAGSEAVNQANKGVPVHAASRPEVLLVPATGAQNSPAVTSAPPKNLTGREAVDLCDYGTVDEARMPAKLEEAADSAILVAIQRLERSKHEDEQVLGLSMRTMMTALRATAYASNWDAQNCFVTDACDAKTKQAQHRAALPAAETLARLAKRSINPQTYASSLRACRFIDVRASRDCSALAPEGWARLDADNGFAWLEVAAAARQRRDFATNDYALQKASRSKTIDWRVTRYGEFLAGIDARSTPVRALVLSLLYTAYQSEERFVHYVALGNYCHPDKLDAGRHQVCNNLAKLLVDRDPGLLGPETARSLAVTGMGRGVLDLEWARTMVTRGGFAPAVLSYSDAGLRTQAASTIPSAEHLSCEWAAQTTRWLEGVSKYGERGYLTKLLKEQAPAAGGQARDPSSPATRTR
jgi:hypothetical protein